MSERMTFDYEPTYGGTEKVGLSLSMYVGNGNLYMGMSYYDPDLGWDHYGDVTVNVTENSLPYLFSAIDTNNNGQNVVDFLVENGIARPTGIDLQSGFCRYPVMEFEAGMLEKISPGVFRAYQEAHGIGPRRREASVGGLAGRAEGREGEERQPPRARQAP